MRANKYLHRQTDKNMHTDIAMWDFLTNRYVVDEMIAGEWSYRIKWQMTATMADKLSAGGKEHKISPRVEKQSRGSEWITTKTAVSSVFQLWVFS